MLMFHDNLKDVRLELEEGTKWQEMKDIPTWLVMWLWVYIILTAPQ